LPKIHKITIKRGIQKMIWNETMECMKREDMRKLQGIRLKQTVERVYHNTPFYRKKMQEIGITPNDINSIDDIVKLPFTTKQDLRDNYPFGLFAVPMSEIVRLHASSGTTGRPTVVGYTRQDLVTWAESVARCLSAYGTDKNDIFHIINEIQYLSHPAINTMSCRLKSNNDK